MRISIVLAALMLAGGSAAAAPAPSPEPSPKPAATVHIAGYAYKPPTVTVKPGDTVQFVNDDDDAHTVTASDKSFDSGGLDTHESWRKTFTKPGTYAYFCALHPYMKAVVIVRDDKKGT